MKSRIEISCTEDVLHESVYEAKQIVLALELVSLELKVFHDKNRSLTSGHSWITVTNQSSIGELCQIYELKRKVSDLVDELEAIRDEKKP